MVAIKKENTSNICAVQFSHLADIRTYPCFPESLATQLNGHFTSHCVLLTNFLQCFLNMERMELLWRTFYNKAVLMHIWLHPQYPFKVRFWWAVCKTIPSLVIAKPQTLMDVLEYSVESSFGRPQLVLEPIMMKSTNIISIQKIKLKSLLPWPLAVWYCVKSLFASENYERDRIIKRF